MAKKLFVGNFSFELSEQGLMELFSACGTVASAKVIKDYHSGRSKGFGFVEMSTETEAQEAIKKYDGVELEGRALRVNEAKPRNAAENSNPISPVQH